jgi:hypothetical protein
LRVTTSSTCTRIFGADLHFRPPAEAGERLFTFTRLPSSQWRSARTSNAVERLHEEFKRRIKTQTVTIDTVPTQVWP